MLKKYLPHGLILIGLMVIIIAMYQIIATTYYQNKLVDEYDNHINQLHSHEYIEGDTTIPIEPSPDELNKDNGEKLGDNTSEENPIDNYLQGKEISGIIEIPKLGVKAAILEGTDDKALKYTVGHYPGTAKPGEKGNYVLLGHRNYVYGHYFRRINELKVGDEVIIKKDTDVYTYIVTESFVVSPEEVWVLDPTEDAILTMITCTPMITYTDRLIVRGIILEK